MAEQNILSADQSVLEQILSDINEYEENQERLEYISASIKDITKAVSYTHLDVYKRQVSQEVPHV